MMKLRKSKLNQGYLFRNNALTKHALPSTIIYNPHNLLSFLKSFGSVYLKPDAGLQGIGVIRVTKINNRRFLIQDSNGLRIHANSERSLLRALSRATRSKRYIVQRAIRSLTKDNRPFDIRVHVQRLRGKWVIGGIVGRLGRRGEIVTNRHRGARPVSVDYLFRTHLHMSRQRIGSVKQNLARLSLAAAKEMQKAYPYRPELGIDIGMDSHRHLWIYEANTAPGIHVFEDLQDRTSLQRILRNRRARNGKLQVGKTRRPVRNLR